MLFTYIRYLCDACDRRFVMTSDGTLQQAGNGIAEPHRTKNPGKPAEPSRIKPIFNLV